MDALCQQGDPQYKRFHLGLVPGLAPDAFLGVRMPVLRKEARRILKEAPEAFLEAAFGAADPPYEIRMLQGLVIAQLPCPLPQRLQLCLDFLPLVDNWAVCDSFCAAMTCAKKEPASVLAFLRPLLASEQVYHVRFACVMLLHYFMDDIHIQDTLALYDGVSHPDYYVKMAVAWGISQGLTVQWEATIGYLCGIGSKLVAGAPWNEYFFVYIVYVLNTVMVVADLVMYYINRAGEKKREKASA